MGTHRVGGRRKISMSQGLRNMSAKEQAAAIERRLKGKERGLGYLAAQDAVKRAAEVALAAKKPVVVIKTPIVVPHEPQ